MEKITNIEIKNFKSIRHQKIDGCKRINVFVGKPNVGKSNILEALSVLQFGKLLYNQPLNSFVRFEDAAELFFEANIRDNAIVSYNEKESVYINFIDNKKVDIVEAKHNPLIDKLPFNHTSIITDLIDVFKYQFLVKPITTEIATFKHLQSPFGENLFLLLRELPELRKAFNKYLDNYGFRLLIDKVSNTLRIFKEMDEDSVFTISYSLIADTLQRLFFYKTAIYSNKDAVLLFEEPESHMYPPYISKFTSDIIYDENDNQFFLATHSPYVLNDFMEDAKDELSIYLVDYKDGETIVYKLDDEEIHVAYQFGYDFFMNIENFIPHAAHEKV